MTVIRFSFFFQLYYDVTIFQVIWAIGACMVVFAALIHLPFKAILSLGIVITVGHDVLHVINLRAGEPFAVPWTFIHQFNFIELSPGHSAFVPYPFLPWLGITLLGYCLGEWYTKGFDPALRRTLLMQTGFLALIAFFVLRAINLYGDPAPWSQQKDIIFTMLSFFNTTKYPVSLLYTLMTLGPVLMLLSVFESAQLPVLRPFAVVGRVPLFYYIPHFYLLHAAALCLYMIRTGKTFSDLDLHFNAGFGGLPPGYGFPLVGAYVAWISVVVLLYPLCKRYNRYKSTHRNWWLSYL